jgi:hypothetical protein
VGGLLSAGQWATAAIVWAFTEPGEPHFASVKKLTDGKLTITDFATLGIRGLSSRPSIIKYRSAWQTAIDNGWAESAEPGKQCVLPKCEEPFDFFCCRQML